MIELFVPNGSTFAGDIDKLFMLVFIIVMPWFFLVEGILFYFIFKFRRKEGVKAIYMTGEKPEEKKWISWPHIAVILCDIVLVVGAAAVWYKVKQGGPEPQEMIRVTGQQWAWIFQHPGPDRLLDTEDDIHLVDELHVKKGVVYGFILESRDVLHSFSVPIFRLKQDAVPGRTIKGWFEPTLTGEYDIQCAEMCGIGHGLMGARIFVESQSGHTEWMASNTPITRDTNTMVAEKPADSADTAVAAATVSESGE
jgi:cytochrome c oxidase subunit 2